MLNLSGSFTITEQQSQDFALLSGDFNPLHVDPVYARRLQFGQTVIHGVHHLLRVCNEFLVQVNDVKCLEIKKISATFPNPVSIGEIVKYEGSLNYDDEIIEIFSYCSGKIILSLRVHFFICNRVDIDSAIINKHPPKEEPFLQTFPPLHSTGSCDLFLDSILYKKLFCL